ncbi:hypothetical protein C8J56DRAFT_1021519 [Mycena floridula]|nr:hypothetical protein C8J56DRAFT_1021519 [Mycena floridula]
MTTVYSPPAQNLNQTRFPTDSSQASSLDPFTEPKRKGPFQYLRNRKKSADAKAARSPDVLNARTTDSQRPAVPQVPLSGQFSQWENGPARSHSYSPSNASSRPSTGQSEIRNRDFRLLSDPDPYNAPPGPRRGYSEESRMYAPNPQFMSRVNARSYEDLSRNYTVQPENLGRRPSDPMLVFPATTSPQDISASRSPDSISGRPRSPPQSQSPSNSGFSVQRVPIPPDDIRQYQPSRPIGRVSPPRTPPKEGYVPHAAYDINPPVLNRSLTEPRIKELHLAGPPQHDRRIVDVPQDETSIRLQNSWAMVQQGPPKKTSATKTFEKIGDAIHAATAGTEVTTAKTVVNTVVTTLEGAGIEKLESGIKSLIDQTGPLLKALDEVAKLHPFIGVAVMTFKAVWALEMKRRENDRRIKALYLEMRDVMAVLIQLKDCKDPTTVSPDGSTIEGRMGELARLISEDIKQCANLCDTLSKKKLIVKVLKGPVWEGKLVAFVGLFTKRRSELEFAMAVHTAVGIDTANKTLGVVDKTVQDMNAKMDAMTKMFEKLLQPEHKAMAQRIQTKGGIDAVIEDDDLLKEISGQEGKAKANADLEDLKEDLATDPDVALEKNAAIFSRKFEVQKRQIIDEVSRAVQREGDRIIGALNSGPHDKIIDPVCHSIWKEMGWRGSVKIRHFVMSLRDHYEQKQDSKDEEWALAYINILRVQPISEAFDDDASGFVTIQECNEFTTSRPLDWTLPHWIAFWSHGWHQALFGYTAKIKELIAKLFAVLPAVKPLNQSFANDYISSIYVKVTSLSDGVTECIVNESLQEKFQSYIDSEEKRLEANLDAIEYDIDAADTLVLVTGEGRIEKYALPLIYLLLKRHFEIFRVAQKRILHPDELWDAADTMEWVFKAIDERVETLQAIFRQQRLDLREHFKSFAHGMLQYINEPNERWNPAMVQAHEPPHYSYTEEASLPDVKKITNYPVDEELKDFAAYNVKTSPPSARSRVSLPLRKILGPWFGFHYRDASSRLPVTGMFSLDLMVADQEGTKFKASSRSNGVNFTVSGECYSVLGTPNVVNFVLKMTFPAPHVSQHLKGSMNESTQSLTGVWWTDKEKSQGVFLYKRMAPEMLCFYPSPTALKANKASSLWQFAIQAVRFCIRRKNLSWPFFQERGEHRRRFIHLYIRNTKFGRPLDDGELEELRTHFKSVTHADLLFFISLAKLQVRKTIVHAEPCESCGGLLGGARLSCLTCQLMEKFDTIDFCEHPECLSKKIVRPHLRQPHLPSHDLFKTRRMVHIRHFGKTYRDAKAALQRARSLLAQLDRDRNSESEVESPQTAKAQCSGCHEHVSLSPPCWFCVHCSQPTFICYKCEAKKFNIPDHDFDTHDLVRCAELVEEVVLTVEDRLSGMDERLGRLESTVNERLSRMEKLLERLLGKLEDGPLDSIISSY